MLDSFCELIRFILHKPLKHITSYLVEPLWQKTHHFPEAFQQVTSYLPEPLWQKHFIFRNPSSKLHLIYRNPFISQMSEKTFIGQMSKKTCVLRHLTDKPLENEKFKVSVKCLFCLLWIRHLTYRSDVYRSDGV